MEKILFCRFSESGNSRKLNVITKKLHVGMRMIHCKTLTIAMYILLVEFDNDI